LSAPTWTKVSEQERRQQKLTIFFHRCAFVDPFPQIAENLIFKVDFSKSTMPIHLLLPD
jgi:hypothetical protein